MNNKNQLQTNSVVNFLEYWGIIRKNIVMIVSIVVVISLLAVIISLNLTKTYKSESTIVPTGSGGMGGRLSSLAGGLGSLLSLPGLGSSTNAKLLVSILKSRTIASNVIEKVDLMPLFYEEIPKDFPEEKKSTDQRYLLRFEQAITLMKKTVAIDYNLKNDTIAVTAIMEDPEVAAKVVNMYISELQLFLETQAVSSAKRHRIFLENQVFNVKREILETGNMVDQFYKNNQVSVPYLSIDVGLISKGQQGDYKKSVDDLMSEKELSAKKLRDAKRVKDVSPRIYFEYLVLHYRLLMELQAMLTTQYEMAKIQESKEEISFNILDSGVPSIQRHSPRRGFICVISFFLACALAVFIAFFREYIHRMKSLEADK